MFHYAIPLRAKQTSNNWNEVCVRLEATIKSIEIAGGDYRIVVACHDIPEFTSGYQNPRTEFIKVWHPVPEDKNGYMADKASKKNVARRRILETKRPYKISRILIGIRKKCISYEDSCCLLYYESRF